MPCAGTWIPSFSIGTKMPKPQAFLVVGHSNWGKSQTIRALTGGRRGWVRILGRDFFVRLMSNDDPPVAGYRRFIGRLRPARHVLVVAPYCPEPSRRASLLAQWASKYTLRLWVLADNYHGGRAMHAAELAQLQRHGTVAVFHGARVEAPVRAVALRRFIARYA